MTVGAAARLDTEGIAQQDVGTYRHSQHDGHGCCQDGGRLMRRSVYLGHEPGRTLMGVETLTPVDRQTRAIAIPLRCRSWRCGCCAVRLRRRARARALMGASGQRVALLTLTVDPSDPRLADPANRSGKARPVNPAVEHGYLAGESTRYAAWAFNRFRTYMVREFGGRPYFRGLELQRSGMAHLHVLVRVESPADFMALRAAVRGDERVRSTVDPSDRRAGLAIRAGFGLVVDLQLARSGGDVAKYVTKASHGDGAGLNAAAYATKGIGAALPRYARRASWSQGARAWAPGWVKPEPIRGFTWRVVQASAPVVTDALVLSEFAMVAAGDARALMAGSSPAGG